MNRKIITAYNFKGGVWKTSTTHNLAYALGQMGHKVLMIDLDPQASLTICCGIDPMKTKYTAFNLMTDEKVNVKPVKLTENVFLVPADLQLSLLDRVLMQLKKPSVVLKRRLEEVQDFEYILIDTPPVLSLQTSNAIFASDVLLVPVDCSYLSYMGLKTVEETVEKLGKKIGGIVATRYNPRINDCKNVVELLKKKYEILGTISETTKAKEALYHKVPIVAHMPKHKVSEQYMELAENIRRL